MDPATRDAMVTYLGAKSARLVRAAFSHDALRHQLGQRGPTA